MALDVGDARIGVAISDPLRILARPYGNFEMGKKVFPQLCEVVKKEKVSLMVVGLPKELDGTIGPQAEKVLKFVEKLKQQLLQAGSANMPDVELWDERMTTVQANRVIAGSKLKNKARRELLDQVAATIILESYLSTQR